MAELDPRPQSILAAAFLVFALAFAAFGAYAGDTFFLRLATEALILAGLAMAVDVLLGYTGLLSLGHALFFGFGAYASALVLKHWTPSFWSALGATLAAATLLGLAAGFISIRARGVYFALITFGLAQVVYRAVYNTRELGGSDGIIGVPEIEIDFGVFQAQAASPVEFFLVVLALLMLMYVALAYLMRTPFGRTLVAIRTNEPRVPFLGYASGRAKLIAFVIAADVAALAGALYPMLRGFVSPDLLAFQASGDAVIMVVLGGVGTLVGSLYGAVILTAFKSILGTWTEHHLILIGGLFVVSVIFLPRGLAGYVLPRIRRFLVK